METPEDIFEEFGLMGTDPHGPRLRQFPAGLEDAFNEQLAVLRSNIAELQKNFRPTRIIKIHADIVDNGACDAFAWIYKGVGLIGLYKGEILLPLEMLYRIFSHPNTCPDVGDCQKEKFGPQHHEGIPTNHDVLIDSRLKAGRSPLPTQPADLIRRSIAVRCMQVIWAFLSVHEIVHIVHGHVDYLKANYPSVFIITAQSGCRATPAHAAETDLQSLELWSDNVAAASSLVGILKSEGEEMTSEIAPTLESRLYWWVFSIFVLFRIWKFQVNPKDLLAGRTDPPTSIRFQMMMVGAKLEIDDKFPSLSGKFQDIAYQAQRDAEHGIVLVGGTRLQAVDIVGVTDARVIKHRDSLVLHMENHIFHGLQNHAYIDLPKPDRTS